MTQTTLAILGLGFALGARHALEPDHLVAVSTMVSRSKSIARSSWAGTLWGLGHTASLFICGSAMLLLRFTVSDSFVAWMETAVAVMLVLLGLNSLRMHLHFHNHDGHRHIHFHAHRHEEAGVHNHRHIFKVGIRSFFIGMVHGLAGSGALMVLVMATVPSLVAGLAYILLFGLGSIGGMLLLSSLISIPFVLSARRFEMFNNGLQLVTALLSIALGLFWISFGGTQ